MSLLHKNSLTLKMNKNTFIWAILCPLSLIHSGTQNGTNWNNLLFRGNCPHFVQDAMKNKAGLHENLGFHCCCMSDHTWCHQSGVVYFPALRVQVCCLGWWRRSRDAKCCKWGQSSVLSVLFAVTGWWSQMTVTWWRADSSLAWCWCLWPAREVMFVSTDQTWRSCGSPSNRPTTRSSTAGFTSGFHSVATIFLWLWSFFAFYLTV